ncbi:MAG: hypothetical protein M1813_000115 [Trichoglossum hirsutum]|jgi:hypothetical protein|nr:MAG: hypothetical protein M1813_000115 [Trichoglossum hirsutum]
MAPNAYKKGYDNANYPTTMTNGGRWTTGFLARLPYLGLLAIVGVIACIAAAIAVLAHSNGSPIHHWAIQPTVWLAVISAIANACLHYALVEGAVIAWWRRAIHGGTIADLHNHWDVGNSLFAALLSGRRFNLVALATVMSTVALVNGPLLQRASTVADLAPRAATDLQAQIITDWPGTYSGVITGRAHQTAILTKNFVKVMQDYTNRVSIKMRYTGCDGTCSATIYGAGFGVTCTEGSVPLNLTVDVSKLGTPESNIGFYTTIFSTSFTTSPIVTDQTINMTVIYKNTTECGAFKAISKTCVLNPSMVEYPIVVSNGTVSLSPVSGVWHNDTIISSQSIPIEPAQVPTVLGGLTLAANSQFNSTASIAFGGGVSWEMVTTGPLAHVYALNDNVNCSLSFSDPTYDILSGLREIAFRHAIASSNGSNLQTVTATATGAVTAYKSNFAYLAIASVIMLAGTVVTLSIFYGWWELGRQVSLSPIETARAFNAPMLQSRNWNGDAKTLLAEVGTRKVKYGELLVVNRAPVPGHLTVPANTPIERHLEMADPSWARPPTAGASYST